MEEKQEGKVRRIFTPDQKFEILKDIERRKTIKEGLEKHQLGQSLYHKWKRQLEVGVRASLRNSRPLKSTDLRRLGMPGISSYYVSGYISGQSLPQGFTVGGELVVARSDGELTKNYQFVFATSSEGQVYFAGPFKSFGHHVSSGQQVSVNSLFNQTLFSTKTGG